MQLATEWVCCFGGESSETNRDKELAGQQGRQPRRDGGHRSAGPSRFHHHLAGMCPRFSAWHMEATKARCGIGRAGLSPDISQE